MRKVLVIYHREDNDGVCSAAIIESLLSLKDSQDNPSIKFTRFGANYVDLMDEWHKFQSGQIYGQKKSKFTKWLQFDEIWMSDISFNDPEAMQTIYDMLGENFHWCDHHKSAIDASLEYGYHKAPGVRRIDQSALLNTWTEANSYTNLSIAPSPFLLKLSDYDSWTYRDKPNVYKCEDDIEKLFAFNTGVTRRSKLKVDWFKNWIDLWISVLHTQQHVDIAQDCLEYGLVVRELDIERTTRAIESHGDTSWYFNNERACALITTDSFNSESFKMFRGTDIHYGITIKHNSNDSWVMTVYSVEEDSDLHIGAYLRDNYDGGGHKGAGGCTIDSAKIIELLKSKRV